VDIQKRVSSAVVQITREGKKGRRRVFQRVGQGVCVPGNFVLTVAHALDWHMLTGGYRRNEMTLGDHYTALVTTRDGERHEAEIDAVEPRSDLAVLGSPVPIQSSQSREDRPIPKEFLQRAPAVPLWEGVWPLGDQMQVYLLSAEGKWFPATATRRYPPNGLPKGGMMNVELVDDQVTFGDSGGPVVDGAGQLFGLVSDGTKDVSVAIPHFALPCWVRDRIHAFSKAFS